jgi:hypothetical protein
VAGGEHHRQRVLGTLPGTASSVDALISQVQQQGVRARVDNEDNQSEVSEHDYIHALPSPSLSRPSRSIVNVLPAQFIPAQVGSEQDQSQQLIRILTTINKSTTKYATLDELATAIDDWTVASISEGWTGQQLDAIRRYRRFVIDIIGRQHSVTVAAKYHASWSKAVHARTHDMFAHNGHIHLDSWVQVPPTISSSSQSSYSKGKKSSTTERKTADKERAVHAVGSCTKHPTSTSHTTAQCKAK